MGYFNTKELQDEISELRVELKAIKEKPENENRAFTDEEFEQFDAKKSVYDQKCLQLESAQRAESVDSFAQSAPRPWKGEKATVPYTRQTVSQKATDNEINEGLKGWMLSVGGWEHKVSDRQRKVIDRVGLRMNKSMKIEMDAFDDQFTNQPYTVNTALIRGIEVALRDQNEMRKCCQVWETAQGNPIPLLSVDDRANTADTVARVGGGYSSKDITFNQYLLQVYKSTTGAFPIPVCYLQDAAFDMRSFLNNLCGERLGANESDLITNGAGTTTVKGLTRWIAATQYYPDPEHYDVRWGDVISALRGAVGSAYAGKGTSGLVCSWATLCKMEREVDGMGRKLHTVSVDANGNRTIDGEKVWLNPSLTTQIFYGDWSKAVIRSQPVEFIQLNEKFRIEYDAIGFAANSHIDFGILDVNAFSAADITTGSFLNCGYYNSDVNEEPAA